MKQKKRSQQIKVDIQMVDSDGNPLPQNAKIKEFSPAFRDFLDFLVRQMVKAIRETTKSRKIRHVPLGEGIYHDLLKAYEGRDGTELVFHLNGEILDKSNLRNRHFNQDIKGSGVSRIRIHDMRHTYASHFMMNGGNLYALQAILGHSDTKMTQRYAHLSKTYFTEKADIVRFGDGKVIEVDFGQKTGTSNV